MSKLIFEKNPGANGFALSPMREDMRIPDAFLRAERANLPEVSEVEFTRHFMELSKRAFGVDDGMYPLGSCTMKYNPKINEKIATLPGFVGAHPLFPSEYSQGALRVLYETEQMLCAVTGLEACSLQPSAGAHGELTGIMLIQAWHRAQGNTRTKMLIPDTAHGTNPASAALCGFSSVKVPLGPDGILTVEDVAALMDDDCAGIMITNPNTLGLFESNIKEIAELVHARGGLVYGDGANLNAIMGYAHMGHIGIDVMHMNLHKTFATPHGGGGPGSGPVGCKKFLAGFLPGSALATGGEAPCQVRAFHGNFLVVVKALAYLDTLGGEGIREAAAQAVLNANYLMCLLRDGGYPMAYDHPCMHEFVITLEKLKHEKDVSALDVAKALLDHGMHPPTMYFPLIVHEALMVEPTETESKESLEAAAESYLAVLAEANENPADMHNRPLTTYVRRLDEVTAARNPIVKYEAPSA